VLVVQRGNRVVKDDGTRVAGLSQFCEKRRCGQAAMLSLAQHLLDFGALRRILESQVVEDFADVAFLANSTLRNSASRASSSVFSALQRASVRTCCAIFVA